MLMLWAAEEHVMMMGPSLPSVPGRSLTASTLLSASAICISSRRDFMVSACIPSNLCDGVYLPTFHLLNATMKLSI